MEIKEFEHMTISQLQEMHKRYLKEHPDEREVQEILDELNKK